MKKILSLTLVAFILLSFTVVAAANGLYISYASNSISKSGTTVYMGQTTHTNTAATRIRHVKYLQRWTGSSWVTYTTVTTNRYGSSSYSDSIARSVTSGYLYRVITYHYVYEGTTIKDVEVRTSGSVFVG